MVKVKVKGQFRLHKDESKRTDHLQRHYPLKLSQGPDIFHTTTGNWVGIEVRSINVNDTFVQDLR